jgi:ATP-dependent Lhr-like helicase
VVSACDPLNLAGVLTPGPRVPAVLGNRLVCRDGVPVASLESGEVRLHADLDDATRSRIAELLGVRAAKTAVPA